MKMKDPRQDKPKKFENGLWRDSQTKKVVQKIKEIIRPKVEQPKKAEKKPTEIIVTEKATKNITVILPVKEVPKVLPEPTRVPKKTEKSITIMVNK